ncbi:extracellular lipase [Aspergillus nomiae NRRL 13137]|uniref:Carboxylic ester hydrolase n=1 Tax=Aspergillus nomiae NRRL (strain ATCC 15546 / NRRL 13137 / CBS 260.88 / M93) TaxID=1509407 RepID=A0A0L1JI53_ASPN3|nr:extracellular lipase [Aspergillus nomiae NRRL 13137]KNG91426.1 extracellular lipase [Aspergillus nomiae NRRL 13137]
MSTIHGLFRLALLPVLAWLLLQQKAFPLPNSPQIQLYVSWLPVSIQNVILDSRPRIALPQGTVVGYTVRDTLKHPVDAFRGIRYALPPIGERRFRRAEPIGPSESVIEATRFGPRCPGKQLLPVKGDTGNSEDCLTVNVFRPHGVQGKLPVAVYVHGGAYNRGTSSMHNTASMVGWSEQPFIGVTFNYRIGALGFLPSTTTAEEGILNLGLHDQILLFKWVQDNIEAFGGDPSQVTLFGLSAGAHSIAHHVMNYDLGHTLFHRVIIESGAATSRAVHSYDARLHEDQFRHFVEEAGCKDAPRQEVMDCLRSQPESAITNASFSVFDRYNPSVRWAFQPAIDGDLIKQRPIDAWKSGKWNKMPILTGFNTNEGTYYVPPAMSQSEEFTAFFRTLLPAYSASDIDTIDNLYPDPAKDASSPYVDTRVLPVGPQYKRVEAAYGHYAYACPVRQTAKFASAGQEPPVFLYRWALNKTVQGGANHGDQMAYETFNPEVRAISADQEKIAGTLHAYFTSFIVSGHPNTIAGAYGDRPVWETYDASSSGRIMVLGEGNDERAGGSGVGIAAQMVDDEWSRKECNFWWTKSGISD